MTTFEEEFFTCRNAAWIVLYNGQGDIILQFPSSTAKMQPLISPCSRALDKNTESLPFLGELFDATVDLSNSRWREVSARFALGN